MSILKAMPVSDGQCIWVTMNREIRLIDDQPVLVARWSFRTLACIRPQSGPRNGEPAWKWASREVTQPQARQLQDAIDPKWLSYVVREQLAREQAENQKQLEPFRLSREPKPVKRKPEPPEPQTQKVLFSGLDCLPGQLDLFDTDGNP